MADYEPVSANEPSDVHNLAPIRRKPVSAAYQPPPAADAPQDDVKDRQVLITTLTTDAKSKDSGSASSTTESNRSFGIWQLWKWELLSLAASASLLIAIIITLREFNDKDLSDWKAPVSINAVISVLSALFKGSLSLPVAEGISQLKWLWFSDRSHRLADLDRFDRASRSTWGAVRFLARQFGREKLSMLASFGAFLALVSLAVDPFSQASVSTVTCQRVVPTPAAVPRANIYSANGGHFGAATNELDAPMQVAFALGTMQPPANSSRSIGADVICPSANCTFPGTSPGSISDGASFMTLTMCQSCLDVTPSLVRLRNDTEYVFPFSNDRGNITIDLSKPGVVPVKLSAGSILSGANGNTFPDGPWLRTSLVDFQGIAGQRPNKNSAGAVGGSTSYRDWTPFAFDCSLRPCVKTFAANVSNGVYAEVEVAQPQYLHYLKAVRVPDDASEESRMTFHRVVDRRIVNGGWVACVGAHTNSSETPVGIPQGEWSDSPLILWYPRDCVYVIRPGAVWAMSQYFERLVTTGALTEANTAHGVYRGDAWTKMLWDGGNINMSTVNRFAEGVAVAVGAQIRRAAEPAKTKMPNKTDVRPDDEQGWTFAHGEGYQSRACIRVRWKWLSYLGILFVAEVVFLVLLIVTNRRSRWSGDWKSSSLALLLQPWQALTEVADEDRTELYGAAESMQTTLSKVDGKWRLVRAGDT